MFMIIKNNTCNVLAYAHCTSWRDVEFLVERYYVMFALVIVHATQWVAHYTMFLVVQCT